jgi:glycosyltransferase involved in cell wall biosynthesis
MAYPVSTQSCLWTIMRLLFDSTTTLRWAYEEPVGTVRVERVLLSEIHQNLSIDDVEFANCDLGRFVKISPDERALVEQIRLSPLQKLARPDQVPPGPEAADFLSGAPKGGFRSRFLNRFPILERGARALIARYPEELQVPAKQAAANAYSGLVESLRIGARALRAPRRTEALAARAPVVHKLPGSQDFSGCTDLLTVGNGWDYLDYVTLAAMKQQFGLRLHAFVHDLIAVEYPYFFHDPSGAGRLHRHYAELCHLSSTLICNSHATAAALERFIQLEHLPRPKIAVSQLGAFVNDAQTMRPVKPKAAPDSDFVVYVSTVEIRKNHRMLLRAWREAVLDAHREGREFPTLMLVGRIGWGVDEVINMARHDHVLMHHVRFVSGISDAELAWLYENCLFSVYPSLMEGWGLPISEALMHGKAVIHSTDPAQNEAAQGLMPAVHADDFFGWKSVMTELVRDVPRRKRLEAVASERFKHRSRHAFAAELFDAIKS